MKKLKELRLMTILCIVVATLAVGLLLVNISQRTRVKVEVNNWWKMDDQLAISYAIKNNTDIYLKGINLTLRYQMGEGTYRWLHRYISVEESIVKGSNHEIFMIPFADWQTFSLVVQVESYVYYPICIVELEAHEPSRY